MTSTYSITNHFAATNKTKGSDLARQGGAGNATEKQEKQADNADNQQERPHPAMINRGEKMGTSLDKTQIDTAQTREKSFEKTMVETVVEETEETLSPTEVPD